MKIEGRPRMWKSKVAVLLFIFATIAFLLIAAVKAKGIPMTAGYDERLAFSSMNVTYSNGNSAHFPSPQGERIVFPGPGTVLPENKYDRTAFEDNIKLMIVFTDGRIPYASRFDAFRPNPESSEMLVQLFDGKHVYASGTGETFAEAMDALFVNFGNDLITLFSVGTQKNNIEI